MTSLRHGQVQGVAMRVIQSLDEVLDVVRHSESPIYPRYSKGPAHDSARGPSRDYEADVDLPGLSVTNISPEPWWSRPYENWVARRICKYLELGEEEGRYPWLLVGTETGRGPDHEPAARFDVGDDST